jgi:hypothetical protein
LSPEPLVPAKAIVCGPVVATANGIVEVAKFASSGDTRPICVPSTMTLTGWIWPERRAARNEIRYEPALSAIVCDIDPRF